MRMAERSGVLVYFEIEPALQLLNNEQRGMLFTAILDYAHYGSIPTFNTPLLEMAWSFVQPSIDRDGERYAKICKQKQIAGFTSDFRKNYAPKHNLDPNDEEALQAYLCQRMSAGVNGCQATTTPTATTNSITTVTPTTKPNKNTTAARTTTAERGVGRDATLTPEEFERNRQSLIEQLMGKD